MSFNPTQWRSWQCGPPDYSAAPEKWDSAWYPYAWALIELKRDEWGDQTQVVDPRQLPPEFNVYGLYWRPWLVVPIKFDGP